MARQNTCLSWASQMGVRCSLTALLLAGPVACGAELDTPSEVDSLRVLAIQKSSPYARPGEDVDLSMLWHDGKRDDSGALVERDVHRIWLGGCNNPAGDYYYACVFDVLMTLASARAVASGHSEEDLLAAAAGLANVESESDLIRALREVEWMEGPLPREALDEPLLYGQFGAGDRFTLPIPSDIITRSPENRDPYGVSFFFFAACAGGQIHVDLDVLDQTVPLSCKQEDGDTTEELLGADDFVIGYASVYAYETLSNHNAVIRGFRAGDKSTELDTVDGELVSPSPFLCVNDECLPADVVVEEGEPCSRNLECASENCVEGTCAAPVSDVCNETLCVRPCKSDGDTESCDKNPIRPLLNEEDNVERDQDGRSVGEQMWVNYFVDRGDVGSTVRLVNDREKGWNADYGTDFFAPKSNPSAALPSDPEGLERVYIWAVVRDNRGGSSWVRQTIFVRTPE